MTATIQARRRLGLTATLIREDGREEDVPVSELRVGDRVRVLARQVHRDGRLLRYVDLGRLDAGLQRIREQFEVPAGFGPDPQDQWIPHVHLVDLNTDSILSAYWTSIKLSLITLVFTDKTDVYFARQLVMERLLEDLSFTAADRGGEQVMVDAAYVDQRLADLAGDQDLSRYIL